MSQDQKQFFPQRVIAAATIDETGARAVRWAQQFAEMVGAESIVAAAFENTSSERPPGAEQEFLERNEARLTSWLAAIGVRPDVTVALETESHDRYVAESKHDDIVVIGVGWHEGTTSWALNSQPHDFAKELPCPIVLVPDAEPPLAGSPLLVGVDGTPANQIVVNWSQAIASRIGRLVHAAYATDLMYDTFDNAGEYGKQEHRARNELGAGFDSLHEASGRPESVLGQLAHEIGAFLTVVGAREEHSFGGMLLGTVVDHLIYEPPGPIAILTHTYLGAVGS